MFRRQLPAHAERKIRYDMLTLLRQLDAQSLGEWRQFQSLSLGESSWEQTLIYLEAVWRDLLSPSRQTLFFDG